MTRLPLATAFLALALAVASEATAATGASPELTLAYTAANTLEVRVPGGPTLTASSPTGQLAYGAYQIVILDGASDSSDPVHMFELTGPGLNLTTDLQGGDNKSEIYSETLVPNSAYTFADAALPNLAPIVFRTTGTPAVGTTTGQTTPTQSATTSAAGAPGTTRTSNVGVIGSGLTKKPFRGTLTATVSASGTLQLTAKGKSVATIQSGRYTILVLDQSTKNGFILQEIGEPTLTLTGSTFVGRHSATIALQPGQWFYYATLTGRKTYFIVTR